MQMYPYMYASTKTYVGLILFKKNQNVMNQCFQTAGIHGGRASNVTEVRKSENFANRSNRGG
jgi:hypothetical protein